MPGHPLDNPIWHALRGRQREFATGDGPVLRYRREVAPFAAVATEGVDGDAAMAALLEPGEPAYMLGPKPRLSDRFVVEGPVLLPQMVCPAPVPEADGADIIPLTEAHHEDVLELTALVYPTYFRPRTTDLGRYFGIYQDGRLAALIGERMGLDDWQEVSAVCTHPDFTGRGHARRLLTWLGNDNLARGRVPFLHVSPSNHRAIRLYEQNGYHTRVDIRYWAVRRA